MTTTFGTTAGLAWRTMLLALVATGALAAPSTDRKSPTTPRNLRVTGVTAYTVSLAWEPSTDNSGQVRYKICCANVSSQWVEGPASSAVYNSGLEPNRPWTLRIWAVDPSGNWSQPSNSVSFNTTADTTPPTQPLVSATDVGPTHVALMWSATDNDPSLRYTVRLNGAAVLSATANTSQIFPLLQPETTYVFSVQARDSGGNVSSLSEPASATTEARNPDDVTAPTTPSLWFGYVSGCEVQLQWTESTDDLDPQFVIEYEIYLNGVHVDSSALRYTNRVVYADRNGVNTFAVAAVDSAGNRSLLSNELSETFDGCVF
jgi:chitodextrinase